MGKKSDYIGQRFGRLIAFEDAGRSKNGHVLYRCKCDCGNESIVSSSDLKSGHTTSCGCYKWERVVEANTTHGMCGTRLYSIWIGILARVGVYAGAGEETKRDYQDRGITVCDEWLIFENFRDWALSHGYSEDLEIDRRDNDKGYCPENCHWVSKKENVNNRRNTVRLEDGTSLAIFCFKVGIQTRENGRVSRQYGKIKYAYCKHHEAHPELVEAANKTILEMHQCVELLRLLEDVRALKRSISNP